ncbi:MAG: hypothetical protein PHG41_00115 [Actinomycetota bacterium]|nr:hypothetical protein [Actinomycetota bacterium]
MSNKLIIKNSIYLYIRLVVSMVAGFFTSRFLLMALGVSDYGLYNVVGGVVSLMAFVNTIMITTTYRFIAFEEGKPDGNVNNIFNISLSIHLLLCIIFLFLSLTVGLYYIYNYLNVPEGKLNDAVFTFLFSTLITICIIIETPFQGLLVAKEKFSITVPIEILNKILILLLSIALIYLPYNHLRLYVIFLTIIHALRLILYIIYCFRTYFNEVKWNFSKDWKKYKEMLGFTGLNSIEVAAVVGEHQGAAIIINRFFGTILNASFGIANQVNSIVRSFAQSLGQAVVPQITKSYSAGEHKRASNLVILASKYSFFLMAIPMLPILLETDFILNIWLKEVPEYTTIFVQAMLLKSVIFASQYGIGPFIHASGNIALFKITYSSITLLGLPLAYFAFKAGYPPYIIGYIYLLTATLTFITDLILLKAILNYDVMEFLKNSTFKIILVSLSVVPFFIIKNFFSYGWLRFILISLVSEIILFISIYYLGMDLYERQSIKRYIIQGIRKLQIRHSSTPVAP